MLYYCDIGIIYDWTLECYHHFYCHSIQHLTLDLVRPTAHNFLSICWIRFIRSFQRTYFLSICWIHLIHSFERTYFNEKNGM